MKDTRVRIPARSVYPSYYYHLCQTALISHSCEQVTLLQIFIDEREDWETQQNVR